MAPHKSRAAEKFAAKREKKKKKEKEAAEALPAQPVDSKKKKKKEKHKEVMKASPAKEPVDHAGQAEPGQSSAAGSSTASGSGGPAPAMPDSGMAAEEADMVQAFASQRKQVGKGSKSLQERFIECNLVVQTIALKKFRTGLRAAGTSEYVGLCGLRTIKQYKHERDTLKGLVLGTCDDPAPLWAHASKILPEGLALIIVSDTFQNIPAAS